MKLHLGQFALLLTLTSVAAAECPVNNTNETKDVGLWTGHQLMLARKDIEDDFTGALSQEWRIFSSEGQLDATIRLVVRAEDGNPGGATVRFEPTAGEGLKGAVNSSLEKVKADLKSLRENAFAKHFSLSISKSCAVTAKKAEHELEIEVSPRIVLKDIPQKTKCTDARDPLSCVTTGMTYEKSVLCREIPGMGKVLIIPFVRHSGNCTHEFADELRFLK